MLEQSRFSWLTLLLPGRVPADELVAPMQEQINLSPRSISDGIGKSAELELEPISHLFGRIGKPTGKHARIANDAFDAEANTEDE